MSNEIVRYQSLQDIHSIAQTFALSGYFDAKGVSPAEIAKAVTKILAGQEMGFGPFASINGIFIIEGKPTASGGLIATAIRKSGKYDYRIRQIDDAACKIEFFERHGDKLESLGFSTFTKEDAVKAATRNMVKFPRNMLFNRAISNGYKWYCPDVFDSGSVYTPEELGAKVDDNGEYIESTARTVDPSTGEITAVKPEPEQPVMPDENLTKQFHATGTELYPERGVWEAKRPGLVNWATHKRTKSSKELTADEMILLIEKMNDELRARADEKEIATEQEPEVVMA